MVSLELWKKVFLIYQKDPRLLDKWLLDVIHDPEEALETAKKMIVYEAKPDTILLGFSPQVLLANVAISGKVNVITSPEVWRMGENGPGKYSYRLLKYLYDNGYIERIHEVPFAPSRSLHPNTIFEKLTKALNEIKPKVIDISGGTQLVAIAVSKFTDQFTYTYPAGDHMRVYLINIKTVMK